MSSFTSSWPASHRSLLTTSRSEARIFVVPLGSLGVPEVRGVMEKANGRMKGLERRFTNVVGFRPTGWTYRGVGGGGGGGGGPGLFLPPGERSQSISTLVTSGSVSVYGVPYSEHSSFGELVECLVTLRPNNIVPTVNVGRSREQVQRLMRACEVEEGGREGRP